MFLDEVQALNASYVDRLAAAKLAGNVEQVITELFCEQSNVFADAVVSHMEQILQVFRVGLAAAGITDDPACERIEAAGLIAFRRRLDLHFAQVGQGGSV